MNEQELRELDEWIHKHVFGMSTKVVGWWERPFRSYTTDPAAAMQVLEKCRDKVDRILLTAHGNKTWMLYAYDSYEFGTGETLPEAICKFAREVFK